MVFGAQEVLKKRLGRFRAERRLRDAHQLGKQPVALQRERSELLAIDLHAGLVQAVREPAR